MTPSSRCRADTPISVLTINGSLAKVRTGDLASHFGTRNYGFDSRLERLRPPLFPLLQDTWHFENCGR